VNNEQTNIEEQVCNMGYVKGERGELVGGEGK
jgi:hypothetical protein